MSLDAGAVIQERRHRKAVQQVRHAAHVIVVEMGDQQGIDFLDACVFGRRRDPQGIASSEAGVSRVDQQRLARGRHHQRRLPAFRVDEVQVERLGRPREARTRREQSQQPMLWELAP